MKVVLCASYLTIPSTICLLQKYRDEEIVVLSTVKSIIDFFSRYSPECKSVYLELPSHDIESLTAYRKSPAKLLRSYLAISHAKKKAASILQNIRPTEIYFELYYHANFEFWILKSLALKGIPVFFMQNIEIYCSDMDFIKSFLYKLISKFHFGFSLKPVSVAGANVFVIDEKYIRQIGAKSIKMYDQKTIAEYVKRRFSKWSDKKVVLMSGGRVAGNIVSEARYKLITDQLIEILTEKFKTDEIAIKSHPIYESYISKESFLPRIDSGVPMSILFYNSVHLLIGYASAALYEASGMSDVRVVSTINLFRTIENEEVSKQYCKYLIGNMNKEKPILFPETMEEFAKIINC